MGLFERIFGRSKKVEQETRKEQLTDSNNIWFSLPTVSNEFPQTVEMTGSIVADIHIYEDDYRQREFLNVGSSLLVEQEVTAIRGIWENHSKKSDQYFLFRECHTRSAIGTPDLAIPFDTLRLLLKVDDVGQVVIGDGVLENGFSLKTANTSYYGVLNGKMVVVLCVVQQSENTRGEIVAINNAFDLLFVNWCQCDIISDE